MRQMLEVCLLAWPYQFDGMGIAVDIYDPDGLPQHCVRCSFSTRDDDSVGHDQWKRGCPECGYAGYLLEMDGGADRVPVHPAPFGSSILVGLETCDMSHIWRRTRIRRLSG